MMRAAYCALVLALCVVHGADAALDKDELDTVGRFLALDFASMPASEARKPLSPYFWVKETGETFEVTEEDVRTIAQLPEYANVPLRTGLYREVMIINEVSGLGAVIRRAYLGEDNLLFWAAADQSLLHIHLRPELGNTGAQQLLARAPSPKLLENMQCGSIPGDYRPTDAELTVYTASVSVIWAVSACRP
jgi:hypothetical protein